MKCVWKLQKKFNQITLIWSVWWSHQTIRPDPPGQYHNWCTRHTTLVFWPSRPLLGFSQPCPGSEIYDDFTRDRVKSKESVETKWLPFWRLDHLDRGKLKIIKIILFFYFRHLLLIVGFKITKQYTGTVFFIDTTTKGVFLSFNKFYMWWEWADDDSLFLKETQ